MQAMCAYLDGDADFYEGPGDAEQGQVLAQGPQLPVLEGHVSVQVLHECEGVEGVHAKGEAPR